MKKTLLTLIFGIGIIFSVNAQELPKTLNIPEKFNYYQEKGKRLPHPKVVFSGQDKLLEINYDIDNDGKMDVNELYPLLDETETGYHVTRNPIFYGFDINGDNIIGNREAIIDEALDGLNGNEKWIVPLELSTLFRYSENILDIKRRIYSNDIPIPIIQVDYDMNGDGREDMRRFYQIKIAEDGNISLRRQLAEFIDRNNDGRYDESEIYIIINLEKEFREQKLEELLKRAKSFQRLDYI